jgi:hypothetical protein
LIKRSECKVRRNSEAGVPSTIEVSSVSCCDTFLKNWKDLVYGWKMRQKWLSVSGAVIREEAMTEKARFKLPEVH